VGMPVMAPPDEISTSVFANRVDIQWPGASENASCRGVAFYEVYRNGAYVENVQTYDPVFSDSTVAASTHYPSTIYAFDYDFNSTGDSISVVTPPIGSIDARETGVRPTGSYWGGGGEQIDMR